MTKKILSMMIVISVLMTCLYSVSFAKDETKITSIDKNLIFEANQGNVKSREKVDEAANKIIDLAKQGDKDSQEVIKNLACFDNEKVKAKLPKGGLKLKSGEEVTYIFDDGSYVTYTVNGNQQTEIDENVAEAQALVSVDKKAGFGVAQVTLTCNADNTGSTRTNCHIANAWPSYWSIGLTVTSSSATILTNDQPSRCEVSAQCGVNVLNGGSFNVYMKISVGSAGDAYLVY